MKLSERIRAKVSHTITTNELKLWADLVLVLEAQIPQWISVEDRLPDAKCYTEALVMVNNDERIWVTCDRFDGYSMTWEKNYCPLNSYRVTHWMPLPKAPEEE